MPAPFSDSNDLSLARIAPLATEQITDDKTGAPLKRITETRSLQRVMLGDPFFSS